MNYIKIIKKYIGREVTFIESENPEILIQDDGNGLYIKKWSVKEKPQPTLQELEAFYNQNKIEIDAEIEQEKIISENRARILNKLVENELIREGKINA